VQPFLHEQSAAAIAIGAVNTIVVRKEPNPSSGGGSGSSGGGGGGGSGSPAGAYYYGDNTDWLAIRDLVGARLRSNDKAGKAATQGRQLVALVVGAGGTALAASYAVQQMDPPMQLLVYNRTHAKAEAVAAKFGGRALTMGEMCDPTVLPAVDAVICVIPAAANFELPERLLDSRCVSDSVCITAYVLCNAL
jgi:pentafunctional AROM polypeptide